MSWLARSIANSLKLDDDDDDDRTNAAVDPKPESDPNPNQASPHSHSSSDPNTPRGVKEDLSELTKTLSRQFWGVASFLAPPPPESSELQPDHAAEKEENSLRPPPSSDDTDELSDEALIAGIRSDLSEIGGRFKTGISKLSNNINVSEFTKIASNFLQFGSEGEGVETYESGIAVGVTEEVVALARDLAMHPETWLDFPVPDDDGFDDFDMSDEQQEHALAVERLAPRLAALRIELCPGYMSEGCFWKIYFVLLLPRLNKQDAELLATSQIVEARAMLMQGIQNRSKAKMEEHSESGTSNIKADLPHEEFLSVPSPAQSKPTPFNESGNEAADTAVAVEVATEKHPVQTTEMQVVDKSVIEEEPKKEVKHQHSTSASSGVSIEKFEDDADDWLKEETSEAVGTSATTIPLGNDEDVSFSDLEDDDDDMPINYKKVASGSDSSAKDSREWVQLSRSCMDSVKDVNCVGNEHSGSEQVSTRNPETKESNDWLDIEEIM
ncbi:hypothetical protein Goshw_027817 [Gossypium schwendimanii]|uniref:BSD domain-containing protein n=1 Tax=Gossypium schwendimanii TaxID=34291 RepID=A0A7J9KZK6_GOSSC|nr:hypothetical protein [Gossypium schwendimanii]